MRSGIKLFILMMMANAASGQYIPKFDLQGHRGARGVKPENTIPAFIAALDYGVTTIELDVVISKDKQVVVSHEPWMSAEICMKPDSTRISKEEERKFLLYQMEYADIRKFDCGSSGNARFPEQERIPTNKPLLKDAITAVEDHIKNYSRYEVDYNIEIKSTVVGDKKLHPTPAEYSDIVYKIIDQYLPWDRIVIQSFDFRVLKYWHKKYPHVRLSALTEKKTAADTPQSALNKLKTLGFKPSIYSPEIVLTTKEIVQEMHKKKIRVIPWDVSTIADMTRLKSLGVDGIITDYPNRAAEAGLGLKVNPVK